MKAIHYLIIIAVTGSLSIIPNCVFSNTDNVDANNLTQVDAALPPIQKINDNIFKINNIKIDKKELALTIPGAINMSDGLLEYVACSQNGKLHESMLVLHADPYHIQIALLLLGLAPGNQPIGFQGAPESPCGTPLKMEISWQFNGKQISYPPEDLVLNVKTDETMMKADWVFTGSMIDSGQHMAQLEGSVVAIYHDPIAIIDHRNVSGSDDTMFYANKNILPPVGTAVDFKIYAVTDPSTIKRTRCRDITK